MNRGDKLNTAEQGRAGLEGAPIDLEPERTRPNLSVCGDQIVFSNVRVEQLFCVRLRLIAGINLKQRKTGQADGCAVGRCQANLAQSSARQNKVHTAPEAV